MVDAIEGIAEYCSSFEVVGKQSNGRVRIWREHRYQLAACVGEHQCLTISRLRSEKPGVTQLAEPVSDGHGHDCC